MSAARDLAAAAVVESVMVHWNDPYPPTKGKPDVRRWLPALRIDGVMWDLSCGGGGHGSAESAIKCGGLRKAWKQIVAADAIGPARGGAHPEHQCTVLWARKATTVGVDFKTLTRGGGERGLYRYSGVQPEILGLIETLPLFPETMKVIL